jgi:hypothetical protein
MSSAEQNIRSASGAATNGATNHRDAIINSKDKNFSLDAFDDDLNMENEDDLLDENDEEFEDEDFFTQSEVLDTTTSSNNHGDNDPNGTTNSSSIGKKRKKLVKKAPTAPKRFKSAYIFFVKEKMDDFKKDLPADKKVIYIYIHIYIYLMYSSSIVCIIFAYISIYISSIL